MSTAPRAVLGTMTFGDTVHRDTASAMLDLARDAGVTEIDTANGYAGGASEAMLGDLLRTRRGVFSIATKAGIPHPDAGDAAPLSAPGLRAAVYGSLRRLGVEHLDRFYLHQPDAATPFEETVETVTALVDEGLIGEVGVSNFAAWQICELGGLFRASGTAGPAIAQQLYSLLARRIEEEYVGFAARSGIGTMVYNPLAGGLLTDRYRFDHAPDGGRFGDSTLSTMYQRRYWDRKLFDAVSALSSIAETQGIGLPELALRWLCSRPVVDAVLLGASRVDQLGANLEALRRGPLPEDVVEGCDQIGDELRGPMPPYNR